MKMNGFPKCEHLCLKKDIETLFSAGSRAITIFPLRAVFRVVPREGGPQAQVLVSVAKRRLRHAVDRNRAKRQLREAYRLNKQLIADVLRDDERLHVGLIWLSERPVTSAYTTKWSSCSTVWQKDCANALQFKKRQRPL